MDDCSQVGSYTQTDYQNVAGGERLKSMAHNLVKINGKQVKPGQTCTVDHIVQTYTVVVRSMGGVNEDRLRDVIQKQFEVVSSKLIDETFYVSIP